MLKLVLFGLFKRVRRLPLDRRLDCDQGMIQEHVYESGGNLGTLELSAAYYGK
jgi:hypothetical protein